MGALSSTTGIALVVPAYFVCAGILLFAAVVAVVLGLYRGRASIYLAFAAACLGSAGVALSTASYYLSESIAGAIATQRWLATSTLVVTGALVAFVALYTEARSQGGRIAGIHGDDAREDLVAVGDDRGGGLVAARLDSQDARHGGRIRRAIGLTPAPPGGPPAGTRARAGGRRGSSPRRRGRGAPRA